MITTKLLKTFKAVQNKRTAISAYKHTVKISSNNNNYLSVDKVYDIWNKPQQSEIDVINKFACNTGGTTAFIEMAYQKRIDIILLMPNTESIIEKEAEILASGRNCIGVYEGVTASDICSKIVMFRKTNNKLRVKYRSPLLILCTYASQPKIELALHNLGIAKSKFSLIIDEWQYAYYGQYISQLSTVVKHLYLPEPLRMDSYNRVLAMSATPIEDNCAYNLTEYRDLKTSKLNVLIAKHNKLTVCKPNDPHVLYRCKDGKYRKYKLDDCEDFERFIGYIAEQLISFNSIIIHVKVNSVYRSQQLLNTLIYYKVITADQAMYVCGNTEYNTITMTSEYPIRRYDRNADLSGIKLIVNTSAATSAKGFHFPAGKKYVGVTYSVKGKSHTYTCAHDIYQSVYRLRNYNKYGNVYEIVFGDYYNITKDMLVSNFNKQRELFYNSDLSKLTENQLSDMKPFLICRAIKFDINKCIFYDEYSNLLNRFTNVNQPNIEKLELNVSNIRECLDVKSSRKATWKQGKYIYDNSFIRGNKVIPFDNFKSGNEDIDKLHLLVLDKYVAHINDVKNKYKSDLDKNIGLYDNYRNTIQDIKCEIQELQNDIVKLDRDKAKNVIATINNRIAAKYTRIDELERLIPKEPNLSIEHFYLDYCGIDSLKALKVYYNTYKDSDVSTNAIADTKGYIDKAGTFYNTVNEYKCIHKCSGTVAKANLQVCTSVHSIRKYARDVYKELFAK